MKLVEGKFYTLCVNGVTFEACYGGYDELWNNCHHCGKEIKKCHFFICFDEAGNEECYYRIGSTCIKKVIVSNKV